MAAAYIIPSIDLATPRSRVLIDGTQNAPVATVTVIQLPGGAVVSLHIGQVGLPIPLLNQGMSFELCPEETGGLFLTNPVGAGLLILLISFATGEVSAVT